MKTHEFTILAHGMDATSENFEDRFYNAGCSDATISLWQGAVVVEFAREAPSFDEALASALVDLRRINSPIKMDVTA